VPASGIHSRKLESISHEERSPVRKQQKDSFRDVLGKALLPQILLQHHGLQQTTSVIADFTCILLNFVVISQVRALCTFALNRNTPFPYQILPSWTEFGALFLYGILFTLLGYSERLYEPATIRMPRDQRLILGKVAAWSAVLAGAVLQIAGTHVISIVTLATGMILNFGAMLSWRKWWQWRLGKVHCGERNVLIVGAGILGRKIASQLTANPFSNRTVAGFLDDNEQTGGSVLGRIADLPMVARTIFADEIIVALPYQHEQIRNVVGEARRNGLDIKVVPDLHGFGPEVAVLANCGGVPLLTLHESFKPALGLFLKRALDITGSVLGLLFLLPLFAVIALVIKLDSQGTVFYQAPRVGKKGTRFPCHKFRTMVNDADARKALLRAYNERQGACFKITNDPRITRVGGFLRRYSLDELPQLWNVLCGEMSLVGPRPHPLDDFERYSLEDLRRLKVMPGITGWWQVNARRDPSFRRNVALDVEYIDHWNLWMDFRILYKTVSVVLQGSGA
jgi:exopolysaccharide biosynthesis polyprenyl glycosylphosphotransferase